MEQNEQAITFTGDSITEGVVETADNQVKLSTDPKAPKVKEKLMGKRFGSFIITGNFWAEAARQSHHKEPPKAFKKPILVHQATWVDRSKYTGEKLREIRKTHR